MLSARLLPAFGSLPLDRITPAGVTRWFDGYSRTAPGGANYALDLLRRMLNHAVTCGHLDTNPARGIKRNPRPKLTRFLSRDEVQRLHSVIGPADWTPIGAVTFRFTLIQGGQAVMPNNRLGFRTLSDTGFEHRHPAIRALRLREQASQAVFARHLNVTTGLVSQWERGEKRPRGASLKLLTLVAKNGLGAVA